MERLLHEPTTVLVVGGRPGVTDAVRSAVDSGSVSDVFVVESVGDALDALEEHCGVGCLVLADEPTDASVVEACEHLYAADRKRPILLAMGKPVGPTEAKATTAGASEIVLDEATLPERVQAATERYERRRDREAESSMFDAFVDGVEGAIFVKDALGRHLRKSTSPGDFSREEFIGNTDIDVYGENENTKESYADDRYVVESEEPIYDKEASYTTPDGKHWSRTTKIPWEHDGEVVGLVGWTRDCTDDVRRRHRLDRQEERIERFVRSLRHDLKNPIQIAAARINMARETGDVDGLDKAKGAVARIDEIVDDVTETTLEEGPLRDAMDDESARNPRPLTDLIDDIWDLVGAESATLETEFAADAVITAPDSSVRPVLENLLKNAVDHGGPAVTVRVGPLDAGGFYVADDGPGIPESDREAVFEEGYTTAHSGTGTGLSIVEGIARRRDWDVDVTDSWADGTRVEVRNALVVADPTTGRAPGEELELSTGVDVGDVRVAGESMYDPSADEWQLAGAGKNIYGQWNELHYRCLAVDGPVRIEGRIASLDGANEWSTAGVMVRDSLDEDAAYGHVGGTVGHGTKIDWRTEAGEDGTSRHLEDSDIEAPWYRIDRVGDTLTIASSVDGDDWQQLDQRRVELEDPVYVGLTVCSVEPEALSTATADAVTVTRLVDE